MITELERKEMILNTQTLHRIWTFVDKSNPHIILELSDQELTQSLTRQVESISALSSEEISTLKKYIAARTPLIRDLAYSRVA